MKALALALLLVFTATGSAVAEEPAVVATVNGDVITADRLDELWNSMSPELMERYSRVGGKATLLNAYLRKRILLQEAVRTGFPGAAALDTLSLQEESALFNRYVTEHFGSQIVTDQLVNQYYVQNPDRFRHMDQSLVRQIFVSTEGKSIESAREKLGQIMSELHHVRVTTKDPNQLLQHFAKAAEAHSEDKDSAANGGSLGWRERFRLDPALASAAFTIEPGTMSGMLTSEKGVHLLFVENRRAAGMETLENAAPAIRRTLVKRSAADILKAAEKRTDELMATSKVEIHTENIQ